MHGSVFFLRRKWYILRQTVVAKYDDLREFWIFTCDAFTAYSFVEVTIAKSYIIIIKPVKLKMLACVTVSRQ